MAAPDPDDLVRHTRFVKSLARELARDESEADDLAARTMAEAVARHPGTGPSLRVWLRRVLWRIFRRERRDEERRARHAIESAANLASGRASAAPATVELVARIELEQTIAAAFAGLEEPYKSTLFLRFYDDCSPSQIAAQTATPVETVKTRLKRGLERLRARLDAEHGGHKGVGEWRAVALALAKQGGTGVAIAKTKSLVAAAVVVALVGVAVWELVPRDLRRGPTIAAARAPDPATASEHVSTKTTKSDGGLPASIATRDEEPAELPFAAGIVVDSTGAPLAGVRVVPSLVLEQFDGQWIATPLDLTQVEHDTLATTATDGRFRVAHAPKNIAGLLFYKPGFVVDEWFDLSAQHDKNQEHRVALVTAARVHGRVVDTSGRPIPLAFVEVHPHHATSTSFVAAAAEGVPTFTRAMPWTGHSSHADDDGQFAIEAVNEVPCWLWVSAAGYGGFPVQRELTERDTTVEIVLRRDSAELLDVRDARTKQPIGKPRALAFDALGEHADWLFLRDDQPRIGALNEPTVVGRLAIWCERYTHELKPGATRRLKLVVFAEGYRPTELSLSLKKGEELPHEIVELEPREPVATLSGAVVGAADARLDLRFDPPHISGFDTQNSPPIATLQVGADGQFDFHDLPAASYRLFASAKGFAPVWLDVTAPRDDLSIRFTPAASVLFRVVDHAGAPVAGQIVHVQSLDGHRAWSATSGPDGTARLDELPPGSFDVLTHPPFRRHPSGATEPARATVRTTESSMFAPEERITLVAGANGPLELPSLEQRPVSLRFTFSDGSRAADAKINDLIDTRGPVEWAYDESTRLRSLALQTDAEGVVDVDLYPGEYELVVSVGGLSCRAPLVVPRRGEDEIDVTIGAAPRIGIVRGRVITTPGGHPIAGWNVGAYVLGRDWQTSVQTPEAKTDDEGRFHLDTCPAGSIVVIARDPSDESSNDTISFATVKLDLAANATADVTIPIPRADGAAALATNTLDLTVTSAADGTPVPLVDVLVRGTIGGVEYSLISRSIKCDRDGHLTTPLFACERYHVSLYPPREAHEGPSKWQKLELDAVPENGFVRARAELPLATGR